MNTKKLSLLFDKLDANDSGWRSVYLYYHKLQDTTTIQTSIEDIYEDMCAGYAHSL